MNSGTPARSGVVLGLLGLGVAASGLVVRGSASLMVIAIGGGVVFAAAVIVLAPKKYSELTVDETLAMYTRLKLRPVIGPLVRAGFWLSTRLTGQDERRLAEDAVSRSLAARKRSSQP